GGSYNEVEEADGTHHRLEKGMKILGVLCRRKAVKGFVAEMPPKAAGGDKLHFIGGGGVIARCTEYPEEIGEPYDVEFKGFVVRDGEKLNVKDFSLDWKERLEDSAPLVMVAGTRMDSGKTTLAANLVEELTDRGYRVGAAKLTGFTRQRDRIKMKDYGAVESMDFVDAGIITTMIEPDKVIRGGHAVLDELSSRDLDLIIVELGGGLIDPNHVMEVLTADDIVKHTSTTILTAMDPVAAYGAVHLLEDYGIEPDVFSGPATDTKGGKDEIHDHLDIPALNGRKDVDEIADVVEENL
ncbi:MAG: molybdopterin-guanine dinucleotide biosynthesis protein MobB, partial [Candidatus Nanohaloarchaea archaeon]|nr:molybdopterin-guanine dinucleotide biosynthesis protein MobB [Candidatus Nanohaloarchaea archaeon]